MPTTSLALKTLSPFQSTQNWTNSKEPKAPTGPPYPPFCLMSMTHSRRLS